MPVDMNIGAIIAATLINMVVGFVWYSKSVLGKTWQKLVGLSDKDMASADKVTPMVAMAIMAFAEIFVLNHFVNYAANFYPEYSPSTVGLLTGFLVWAGFVFPVMSGSYLFAQRRKKLLAIDSGYHFVVLLAAGVVLAVWK